MEITIIDVERVLFLTSTIWSGLIIVNSLLRKVSLSWVNLIWFSLSISIFLNLIGVV